MSWIRNNEWLQPSHDHGVRWANLRRFLGNYRDFRGRLVAAGLLSLFAAATMFLMPLVFWRLQVAVMSRDVWALSLALGAYLGIRLTETVTSYFIRVIRTRISTLLSRDLSLQYYGKVLNLSVEDFIAFRQRTNLFQRVIDAMGITPQFTDVLVRGGQSVIMMVAAGVVICILSPLVFTILAVGSVLLFMQVLLHSRELRGLRQRTLSLNYPLVGKMTEIIDGLFTIKALSASVRVTTDIRDLVSVKADAEYEENATDVRSAQITQAIFAVTFVIAVGQAVLMLMDSRLLFVHLAALYVLAEIFLRYVTETAMLYQQLSRLSVDVGKFYEVLDLRDEADEARASVALREATAARIQVVPALALAGGGADDHRGNGNGTSRVYLGTAERPFPAAAAGQGHVVFDDVEFTYRGSAEPVLKGISLEVMPGEKVALIGKSGVGKTTLIRLLLGFLQPQRGTILVDGVDVASFADKNAYRRQFGVVSQRDVLFDVTIRENLMFGLEEGIPEERLEQALRMVNLWDGVNRLPKELDTRYSEDLFSGGQKQRFFIARALLRRPTVVLLDEPTSALDFENEALVMQAISQLVGDKTTLTIAHRLTTVRDANRVVVLEGGGVRSSGTHSELYDSDEYYHALCHYNSFVV